MKSSINNPLIKPLVCAGVSTVFIMTVFENTKNYIFTNITIWQSHLVTIIFTSAVSVLVTYIALKKYYLLLKILSGFIRICAHCKKICDENNNWVSFESYITKNSQADFTHGFCEECGKMYLDELEKMESK